MTVPDPSGKLAQASRSGGMRPTPTGRGRQSELTRRAVTQTYPALESLLSPRSAREASPAKVKSSVWLHPGGIWAQAPRAHAETATARVRQPSQRPMEALSTIGRA